MLKNWRSCGSKITFYQAGFGHSQNIDLVQNGNIVLADETIVWPTDYEIRQDFETFFLLEK